MPTTSDNGSGIASALKEQLALITFVVLFAGLVSTETYYAGFGVRYQVLEFSITHLVYRGLTAVLDGPWLIVAYLIAMGWLAGGSAGMAGRWPRTAPWVQPITYALVILVVITTYLAGIAAGAHAADVDLRSGTSRLPVVRELKNKDGKAMPFAGYRLLFAGKDIVILFKPAASTAEVPFIHLIKRDDTSDITLSR